MSTNPYTSEVIDRTQQDIERQRQMAMNTLGAQATAANAFGGSRQGVAEGVMAGEYGRMAGDMAAQQRQQNYSQALQAAMSDRQARLGAASQMGQLGQQAFGTSQAIQQQQAQQGLLQQGIQQALIDAARQQYAGYTGAPAQSLQAPLSALGIAQEGGAKTITESQSPGLLSYLQTIGQMCFNQSKEAAVKIWKSDERVDDLTHIAMNEVANFLSKDKKNLDLATHLLFVTKNIERAGDHITNIAEALFYLIEGEHIEGARPKGKDFDPN